MASKKTQRKLYHQKEKKESGNDEYDEANEDDHKSNCKEGKTGELRHNDPNVKND